MNLGLIETLCNNFYVLAASSRTEYMSNYMRQRYHTRRQKAIAELGGKCINCGRKDNLQLDHIDAKKKTFRFSDLNSVSDGQFQEELKNAQLLCTECHQKKTKENIEYGGPKSKHGTYWMYRKYGCRCNKCVKAYKEKLKEWRSGSNPQVTE